MFTTKSLKEYKIAITLGFLVLIAIFFAFGVVSLAKANDDSFLKRAYANIIQSNSTSVSVWGYQDNSDNNACAAHGWAADRNNLDRRVGFRIYAKAEGTSNYILVKEGVANTFRQDLKDAGVCSGGNCGIAEILTGVLQPGVTYSLKMVGLNDAGAETVLEWSPNNITCGAGTYTPPPATCTYPNLGEHISIVPISYANGKVSAKVTNLTNNCTYSMGLASYEAFLQPTFPLQNYPQLQQFLDTQKLFAQDMKSVGPGQTASFSVPVSQCTVWQADLFWGPNAPVPPDFWALRDSGYKLYDWKIDGTLNSCPTVQTLSAVCVPSKTTAKYGDLVYYTANPTGGDGNYTYKWTGSVTGTTKTVSETVYGAAGYRYAYVTVTSGNQTANATCEVYVEPIPDPDLTLSCVGSPNPAKTGQSVTWTANPSGGSSSYSYSWSGTDGLSGNTKSVNKTYATAGSKSATVTVTSGNQTKTANCNIFVEQPQDPLLSGACTVSPTAAKIGDTVTWSASASGGNGTYTYSWSGDVTGSSRTVSKSFTNTGTKSGTVTITSGNQTINRTCNVEITETPINLFASCVASASIINAGEYVTFIANAQGGIGTFNFNWEGDQGLTGNSQTVTQKFEGAGTVQAKVTVSSGPHSATAICTITVVAAPTPLTASCEAIPSTARIGQNVLWSVMPVGGSGVYSYNWSGTDNLAGSGISVNKTYNTAGIKNASVVVTSGNETKTANCSVTVEADPVVDPIALTGSCVGSPSSVNVGQSVIWTANASGGSGNYTYNWSGAVTGNSSSVNNSYQTTGVKTATVTISDGNQTITRNCSVNVGTAPVGLAASCTASASVVQAGQSVTFSASAQGGTGNFAYNWSGSENLSGTNQTVTKQFNNVGTASATVTVTSGQDSITATCSVTVQQVAVNLTGSCSGTPSTVNVGQNVTWQASASGGSGNYSYSWSGDASGTGNTVTRSYNTAGNKTATVTISDGTNSITRNCNVNVISPSLAVSCNVSSNTYRVGDNVVWSSQATGGTGSYTYQWTGTDGLFGNSSSVNKVYSSTGTKSATVTVTSGNQSASANCQVNISSVVVTTPTLHVACYPNPSIVNVGQNINWISNVSGGTGNYQYYWNGTDGLTGNSSTVTKSYSTAGQKTATVVVVSGNQTISSTCNATVVTPVVTSLPLANQNPLAFVYLSQVPYTGIMDDFGNLGTLLGVLAWSAAAALIVMTVARSRKEEAYAGIANEGETILDKTVNFFASVIPGAVASPYVIQDEDAVEEEEDEIEEKDEEDEDLEEKKKDLDEDSLNDIDALMKLAVSKKTLISEKAVLSIYFDLDQDFENTSLELLGLIDKAGTIFAREDGWMILNLERITTLK
jgi:hypothetical protein